jgi:hypothetical protein
VAVHSQVVGGTVLVVLVHLKASVPPFSLLCRADLDGGLVVMRYDTGGRVCTFSGAVAPITSP